MITPRHSWWPLAAIPLAALWTACQVYSSPTTSSFDLEGAHVELTCSDCHDADFSETPPSRCEGCHADDRPVVHWDEDDCGECHSQERWDDLEFDHEEWPLTGAHLETPCEDCHVDGSFDADESCAGCHEDDLPTGHLEQECWHCHDTSSWDPLFAHGGFPLVGGHAGVPCLSCHVGGEVDDTPDDCYSCHADDKPNSHGGGMNNCEECHNVYSWHN